MIIVIILCMQNTVYPHHFVYRGGRGSWSGPMPTNLHVHDHRLINYCSKFPLIFIINPLRKREGTQRKLSNVPVATVSDLKQYMHVLKSKS